MSSSGLA